MADSYFLPEFQGQLDKKSSSLPRPASGPGPGPGPHHQSAWNMLGGSTPSGNVRRTQSRHFDAFNDVPFEKDFSSPWGGANGPKQPSTNGRSVSGPSSRPPPQGATTLMGNMPMSSVGPGMVSSPHHSQPVIVSGTGNSTTGTTTTNSSNSSNNGGGSSSSNSGGGAAVVANGNVTEHNANGGMNAAQASGDDELIPTAIVIKNIPFAIKKEQLLEVMTSLGLPLPYAFNYHFDNGVFRGLAFANFTTPEETAAVINNLNSREIGGRKLRVEYKKMLPLAERERIEREKRERRGQLEEQHRTNMHKPHHGGAPNSNASSAGQPINAPGPTITTPSSAQKVDLNDPDTLEFYSQMLLFRDDKNRQELVFPATLMPHQRRIVVVLCNQLGLAFSGHDKSGSLIVAKQGSLPQHPVQQQHQVQQQQQQQQQQLHQQQPPPPGLFDQVHQPQPQYPQGVFPGQGFGHQQLQQQQQTHQQQQSQGGTHQSLHQQGHGGHQPAYALRGTRSFADIRNPTSYPYNISAPGTPTGFPPIHTPVQPMPHQHPQMMHSGGANSQPLQPGMRGFPYFSQPQLGHGPVTSVVNGGQSHVYPPPAHDLNSLSDSFSSLMSLGGTPISRAPSANRESAGSASPTTSIASIQESAGVIGSKHGVIDVKTIVNDSNESTA